MTQPDPQPRDTALEQEPPELATDPAAQSEPESEPEGDPTTDDPAELSEGRS